MAQKAMVEMEAPQSDLVATHSAYCLIRIKEDGDFLNVYKQLNEFKNIPSCDAVRDYYDMVILIDGSLKEQESFVLSNVMNIPDVHDAVCLPIHAAEKVKAIEDALRSYEEEFGQKRTDRCMERATDKFTAYALLEVEKDRIADVYSKLFFTDGVVTCTLTDGLYNLIILLQGESFANLEDILVEEIRPLAGIMRTRLLQVMNLFDWVKGSQGEQVTVPRINREVWRFRGEQGQIIPLLQAAQDSYGYIPEVAIKYISGVTGKPESEIFGVITFYKQFRLRPLGKYLIRLCDGTACHVNNARMLRDVIEDELKLEDGEDTTPDGLFTLEPVACLGCCSLAPVIMVNETTHASLNAKKVRSILRNYRAEGKTTVQSKGE